MHFILLLALTIGSVSGAPLQLSVDDRAKLINIFKEDLDMNKAVSIIAEEATTIGRTAREHLTMCYINDNELYAGIYGNQTEAMNEFMANYQNMKFTNPDQVMDVFAAQTPKAHSVLVTMGASYDYVITKVDSVSAEYLRKLKSDAKATLVSYTTVRDDKRKVYALLGKALSNVIDGYKALPQTSKNSLEKQTCIDTTIRLMLLNGEMQTVKDTTEKLIEMMRIILQFLFLAGVALGQSQSWNAELQQRLQAVYGDNINMSIVASIVEDGAKRVGMTAEGHAEQCFTGYHTFISKVYRIRRAMEEAAANVDRIVTKNNLTLLANFRNHIADSPNVLKALFHMASIGLESDVKDSLDLALKEYSKKHREFTKIRRWFAGRTAKIRNWYGSVSDEAKAVIDQAGCLRTEHRIFDTAKVNFVKSSQAPSIEEQKKSFLAPLAQLIKFYLKLM